MRWVRVKGKAGVWVLCRKSGNGREGAGYGNSTCIVRWEGIEMGGYVLYYVQRPGMGK